MVRRYEVGRGDGALAKEDVDAGLHIDASVGIAQYRIAAPYRSGVCGPHPGSRVQHDVGQRGIADIACEQRVAAGQQTQRLDALHYLGDLTCRRGAATPGAVAGVIGELDGVYRPDLVAQSLQGKRCCPIADIAVGNMALERKEAHGHSQLATRRPVIIVRRVLGEP